ncbi:EAL domain-containing protein [Erythrobacter donghaensis]|jgi:EAL domain-containing protein (putative c-di-GMP-specific phosphodiesterase class I)/CHASE2 domain-containing sensor protein|uniref:EAL domain-containing protein n=1 Tax=Erythrobacter donghaensis TaxID=267135 RepID=UPI00093FD2CE|nr:EAL domain-containing protein [Erythrobacter donghaensis]
MKFLRRKLGRLAHALRSDSWRIAALMIAALALPVSVAALSGVFRGTENRLGELTFALFDRTASGQVHVVEMDAASMAAIRRWPWPRDHFAQVVRNLDAAGVRSISFDVDFSSTADPAGDAAFAAAIAAAQAPVALPTFGQAAGFGDQRQLDSLPIPALREHAQLASVSVAPDPDGYVRRLPFGTVTRATARPSLAATIAGRSGTAGADFPVDFAIDPASLPRHSFVAIERGVFARGSLEGKDVVIGATAIELGDRYAVPNHGVIPGVIIQALGAETLRRGVPVYGSWSLPLLLACLPALAILAATRRRAVLLRTGLAALALLAGWLGARLGLALWFEIVPALVQVLAAGALRYLLLAHRFADLQRRIDHDSGLPNGLALMARDLQPADRFVIAAQIDDFDALKLAIESETLGMLLRRIAERLKVASGVPVIFRSEERTLAWLSPLPIDELESQLSGLRALMRSPFELGGKRIGVSLTFGVADADMVDPGAHAAHAASQAKRAGKFWRLHTIEAGETISRELSLLGDLDDALRNGGIAVLYQPKLNLATRRIDAVEALVRWNHPERGLLPPDCFIPLFEERGRLEDLTLAVIAQALADAQGWRARGLRIGVAINISAALLTAERFESRALALVARSGLAAGQVTFEVTESAQFDDTDLAIAALERFRAAGIRISMDDYGTGQSALNYLKLLPLSELKIDRMFVAQAHVDKGDAMLVRSTVQLAHELGLKVVAEGIEESACLEFLARIGCDHAQGYFVGRPLAAAELAALAVATDAAAENAARAAAQAQAEIEVEVEAPAPARRPVRLRVA